MTKTVAWVIAGLALAGCNRSPSANDTAQAPAAAQTAPERLPARGVSPIRHDLSVDEAIGGHTLSRHVGKTDAELRDRLRREPEISAASTYTDRETAERVVGAALESKEKAFAAWRARVGSRPNFVLHYRDREPVGRSISRGRAASTPCRDALVVLRWDNRSSRFYVLTSYPEESR